MAKKRMSRSQEYVRNSINRPSESKELREERKKCRDDQLRRKSTYEIEEQNTSTRRKAKNIRRRILSFVILGIILMAVGFQGIKIHSLIQEKEALLEVQQDLIKERAQCKEELSNVNSVEYIEQQAREQLKLIMPGEILYIFPKIEEDTEEGNTEGEAN